MNAFLADGRGATTHSPKVIFNAMNGRMMPRGNWYSEVLGEKVVNRCLASFFLVKHRQMDMSECGSGIGGSFQVSIRKIRTPGGMAHWLPARSSPDSGSIALEILCH